MIDMLMSKEVQNGMVTAGKRRRVRRRPQEWVRVFQAHCTQLGQDKSLTLQHHRVLWYLMGQVTYREVLPVAQSDIAAAFELPVSNIARVLKVLVRKGILLQGWDGNMAVYSFNSTYVYKGEERLLLQRRAIEHKQPPAPRRGRKEASHG